MTHGFRFGLLVSAVLGLAVFKSIAIGVAQPLGLWSSWALEAVFLGWLWLASEWIVDRSWPSARVLSGLVFYPLFYLTLLCSFAHTYFYPESAARRVSLLDVDLDGVRFFFQQLLPVHGRWTLLLMAAGIHVAAWGLRRRAALVSWRAVLPWLLGGSALTAGSVAFAHNIPSPVADVAGDLWRLATKERIVLDDSTRARYPLGTLDKSGRAPASFQTPFKKVLVFVMETETARKLSAELPRVAESSFFKSQASHLHRYHRYFPNNQDSRTGMLDMLSSRLIPYDAYTETGRDHYTFLSKQSSLVDRWNAYGYETAYALSQRDLEIVVGDLPWKQTLVLSAEQIEQAHKQLLCFVPYEFEHSCEDRALLPQVLTLLDSHERVFLYQEFIWGHDSEYNAASGKTNAEYYSAYLDSVVEHLRQHGQLDETLIVVTSDHGYRNREAQGDLSMYRIPLMFFATRFSAQDDQRLFSHLDFSSLLLHEAGDGRVVVDDNRFVMIFGATGTSLLSVLTAQDDFMLMQKRGHTHFLLRDANLATGKMGVGARGASEFLRLFQDYKRSFDELGGG